MTLGLPHRHFGVTDSTNARARELVETGAPHGTVVTAAEQSAGRGRQGRSWTAPPGKALLYSAILRPLDERHLLLPLAVPVAVCEAAEELGAGIECQIKWPNDVWVEGRKLAGVLIEARMPGQDSTDATGERRTKRGKDLALRARTRLRRWRPNSSAIRPTEDAAPRSVRRRQTRSGRLAQASQQPQKGWAVIGVGLNLAIERDEFPPELRDTATSLRAGRAKRDEDESRRPGGAYVEDARRTLDRALDRWIEADREAILAAWRSRDALLGREISWDGGAGIADGIEDSGDLLVVAGGGDRIVLGAGEVHLRL